jgi:hypothetical protein
MGPSWTDEYLPKRRAIKKLLQDSQLEAPPGVRSQQPFASALVEALAGRRRC